jgi:hypothetical protein
VFTIWYLRQVGDIQPTESEYYFQLVNPEFVPGAAYRAVREVAHRDDQVAAPGEWGPLSTPVQAGAGWRLSLNPAVPGGIYVAPSAPAAGEGSNLAMTFMGTNVKLMLVPVLADSPAQAENKVAARYYVTIDGSSNEVSPSLTRDDLGRAYIELPADAQATEVEVASSLGAEFPTGKHSLRISVVRIDQGNQTASGGGLVASPVAQAQQANLPGIGAIKVEVNRSYVLFTVMSLLLTAGMAFEAWVLWRSRVVPEPTPVRATAIKGEGARGR